MLNAGLVLFRRRHEIAIIHTHIAGWNAGFAGLMGHLLGIPVLAKAAFVPSFSSMDGIPLASVWAKWRKRVHYIALTDDMAEDLAANGVAREQIHVIPNGVLLPEVVPGASRPPCTVLYVGNFKQGAAHKAFDVLLEAWARVVRQRPEARLVMAGAGDSSPWQALAQSLGCRGNVDFIGYQADLSALYRTAAVLVLPSRAEGISNALLEAMSHGLPVVVSDIPANRSAVDDGISGIAVPVGDPQTLAEGLLRLLGDDNLRAQMGLAARQRMETHFAIDVVVNRIRRLYDDLPARG